MLRAAGRGVLAVQRTVHTVATCRTPSPSLRLHLTSHPPAQLTRLFSSLPRLRSLDVSCSAGGSFDVDLATVELLLSSLPSSLEELHLRGWGIVLEPQQLEAAAPEERLPRHPRRRRGLRSLSARPPARPRRRDRHHHPAVGVGVGAPAAAAAVAGAGAAASVVGACASCAGEGCCPT